MILFFVENAANFCAKKIGTALNGHQMMIPDMLNRRWEKATIIADRLPVTKAAKMAVIVVPMFAPSV